MPIVSVIVPVYNRDGTLERAVSSILTQSFRDLEVIIVNDGSVDCSARVARKLALKDDRVRLIEYSDNRGAQAARNIGASHSKGEWIIFFDSDDLMLPYNIEVLLAAAQQQGTHVAYSDCIVRRNDGEQLFGLPALSGSVYGDLLCAPGPMYQGMLMRADAFREIGGFDESIVAYQEWDTSIRLARLYQFAHVDQPLFVYDCTGSDTISKDAGRAARGYEQVFRKHFCSILLMGPQKVATHYSRLAGYYDTAGEALFAKRCRRRAVLWWPNPRLISGRLFARLHRSALGG